MDYKAKFTGLGHLNTDTLRALSCVIPISLGNTSQTSEKLQVTLSSVSKYFGHCSILIADTLHRYNQENISRQTLHECGKNWLQKNQTYLHALTIPYTIIYWEKCLQAPGYTKAKQKVNELYRKSEKYRLLVQQDAMLYLKRQTNSSKAMTRCTHATSTNSINYFLEETAVTISYFVEHHFNVIIYPGKIPSSIEYVINKYVKPTHPDLLMSSKVYFKKRQTKLSKHPF
ncbi:MAG: hypothetical protein DHS20C10_00920 [marine bacterium B5-7]|nr:MAG: hypothetical protein DHS20C10_00920 [marine bacterium B5-7]